MKNTLFIVSFFASFVVASGAQADSKARPEIQDYVYGQVLDVAKVTSAPDLAFCGIRPVVMGYVDHQGGSHFLRYEANGNACLGDN